MKIKRLLAKNYINFRGWSSNKKFILIESDDWGSVRMASNEAYNDFLSQKIPVNKNYFTKYDCLESKEDLELLFVVLSSFKDKKGNHPVITANTVIANPDFENILLWRRKTLFRGCGSAISLHLAWRFGSGRRTGVNHHRGLVHLAGQQRRHRLQ